MSPQRKDHNLLDESGSEDEIEGYLSDHHESIAAKLAAARKSVAEARTAPMEPLSVLLREARRKAKASR